MYFIQVSKVPTENASFEFGIIIIIIIIVGKVKNFFLLWVSVILRVRLNFVSNLKKLC